MSVKFRISFLLSVLVLILIVIFPSGLGAEKEFKFGTWTYGWRGFYSSDSSLMVTLADTLKFNYLQEVYVNTPRFEAIEQCSLKVAFQVFDTSIVAPGPFYYSYVHYNIWEAEGNDNYPDDLQLTHTQGREVNDGGVGAWMVSPALGDTADIIQKGPNYGQDNRFQGLWPKKDFINYSAAFRVRLGGADPDTAVNDAIAIFSVTKTDRDGVHTAVTDTLWEDDFADTINYIEDTLTYRTDYFCDSLQTPVCGNKVYEIEFRIYWFGKRELYIDKVTLLDYEGGQLIAGHRDGRIRTHIYAYFEDSHSLDAWYMNEELKTGHDIDCFMPWRYVDSLLYAENPNKTGLAAMNDTFSTRYFVNLVNPKQLHVDIYRLGKRHWKNDSLVNVSHLSEDLYEDSLSLQEAWDDIIQRLDQFREYVESDSLEFTTTLQGHSLYLRKYDDYMYPQDTLDWDWNLRAPTGYELECMTNLAIAHGSKGVLYWKYSDGKTYKDSVHIINGSETTTVYDYHYQTINGLTDENGDLTVRWYWIRDKIGPYMEELDSLYYNLTWIGGGSSDSLGSVTGNFIDSIESYEFPDSPYIEVAFFLDSPGGEAADTNYIMLINRRCLLEEDQNVTSYIDKPGTFLIIDLYEDDTTITGYLANIDAIPFTTHLDPGEGKLFKMVPYPDSLHGSGVPMKWQGGLIVSGDVTVDTGKTLTIFRPSEVSFASYSDCESSGVSTSKCEIIVNGSLRIDPGGGGKAKFIPTESGLSPWYGIRVGNDTYPDARIFLDNVEIKQAYCGLDYQSTSAPDTIRNSIFRECKIYGIRCKGDNLVIHDNEFNFRSATCYGIYCDSSSSAKIWGNEFKNLNYGIYINNSLPDLGDCALGHNQFSDLSYGIWVENSGNRVWPVNMQCQDMGDDITESYISSVADGDSCNIYIKECNLIGDSAGLPAETYVGVFGSGDGDSVWIFHSHIHGYYYAGVYVRLDAWLNMGRANKPPFWPATGHNCVFSCHTPCCMHDTCACDVRESTYVDSHYAEDNWWGDKDRYPCIELVDGYIFWAPVLDTLAGAHYIDSCTVDTGTGGPGCPFVYVWNGEEYVEDNNILAESEYKPGCKKDVIDYYLLKKKPDYESGHYKLQIREFEREISYLDKVELLIVDHPKEIMIAVSPGGEVFTCEEIIKPESCFDEQGNDQLEKISSEDKNYFESDGPGYLILELSSIKYDGISALFSGGPPPIKKVGHPSITYNYLKIEIWRDSEFWEEVATIPPRVNVDLSMINLIPYIMSEEEVKIKLSWNDNYKADHIGFYLLKDRIEDVKKLSLAEAGHSESGSVLSQLSKEDGNRAVLNPGQRINLTFASEPEPENLKRDFILVTKGHYVTDKNFASQHPSDIPDELKVSQNYPNPFNPTTEIRYDLPQNAWVKLTVYNVLGQKVKVLVNQHQEAGYKIIHWDSRNEKGEYVSTGIYFYTLQVGSYTKTKKMLLLR